MHCCQFRKKISDKCTAGGDNLTPLCDDCCDDLKCTHHIKAREARNNAKKKKQPKKNVQVRAGAPNHASIDVPPTMPTSSAPFKTRTPRDLPMCESGTCKDAKVSFRCKKAHKLCRKCCRAEDACTYYDNTKKKK